MQISKIFIEGFRCIDQLDIDFTEFTALVGENSSGKSTILQAIALILSPRISIDELDFHHITRHHDKITIKINFHDLSNDEKTYLKALFGPPFGELIIEREISISDSGRTTTTNYVYIPQANNPLYNLSNINGSTKNDYKKAVQDGILPDWILGSEGKGNLGDLKEQIPKLLDEKFDEIEWDVAKKIEVKGEFSELLRILPEPLYVPAFDSISSHVTPKSTNILGKLLGKIFRELEDQQDQEYLRLNTIWNNLTAKLRTSTGKDSRISRLVELENLLSGYVQSVMPHSKVKLEFTQPLLENVLSSQFELKLDDGVVTPVDKKGHGAQRTMIWSLLRTYLEELSGKGDSNVLFLVEEPELYLHPQAQRVMLDVLHQLSENEQVIYSTHSSIFVDLRQPENIRLIRKEQGATSLEHITEQTLEFKRNEVRLQTKIDNAHAELFFAKSVVLIEGETELLILNQMNMDRHEIEERRSSLDELGCQVVECRGKFGMPFFTSLLNDLRIPYFVIFDYDSNRDANHIKTNKYIKNNVQKGKADGLLTKYHEFHPFLENDWDLGLPKDGHKVDQMYGLLKSWKEGNNFPLKYNNLKHEIYNFASRL